MPMSVVGLTSEIKSLLVAKTAARWTTKALAQGLPDPFSTQDGRNPHGPKQAQALVNALNEVIAEAVAEAVIPHLIGNMTIAPTPHGGSGTHDHTPVGVS